MWAASIGLNENVSHRVLVKDDGSSCLQDAKGIHILCTDDPVDETCSAGPSPAGLPDEIAALSDAEIVQLQDTATREILSRLEAK